MNTVDGRENIVQAKVSSNYGSVANVLAPIYRIQMDEAVNSAVGFLWAVL